MLTQLPHLPAASANTLAGTRTLGPAPWPGKAAHRRAANEPHAHNDRRSPAGGAGNGNRPGRLGRSASLIRGPGQILNGLQQTSHVMFGQSAVPVLAKIDLGGVHSQRSVTGPRPCLRAASSTTGSHAAMAHRLDLGRGQT